MMKNRATDADNADDEMEGTQASKAALTSMPYQCQELILYGSVFADNLPDLERRLTGLCDPGSTEFHEHDLSFSLRTGTDPDVTIRLRRRFNVDSFNSHQWQFRYIGGPEPDQKCPVIVRKVIDSIAYSHLMMDFVKTLGLRMDYEYIAKGTVWTNGKMKVVLSQIQKTEKAGHYDQANLKRFSDSYLVEMSVCLPDSAEYMSAAKQLRDFADQLLPLVEMEKVLPLKFSSDIDMTDAVRESDAANMEQNDEATHTALEVGDHVVAESTSATSTNQTEGDHAGYCANEPVEGETSSGAANGANCKQRKLRLAVAGCAHGEMDKIYEVLAEIEQEKGYNFDLLICCGDYQSVRNYGDLHHMHVNEKYRSIQTFYKYYSGEKTAPILTIFVGGNHEASGYLAELPNGGWVAPNIYYMGFANVIRFAGLRIAGLSGIYNGREFNRGHYERPPYKDRSDIVSSYHVRNIDVWRLKQLRPADDDSTSNPVDIMISHDWPSGIVDFGDKDWLLRVKPFFADDVNNGKLGNPSTMQLLYDIRPRYWFAAHLHVAFAALVAHDGKDGSAGANPTRFLALDKPIPRRQFIQALELDISEDAELKLTYDPQWLAILKSTDSFTTITRSNAYLPSAHSNERWDFRPTDEELASISKLGDLSIPENFQQTAKPLLKDTPEARNAQSTPYYRNPQTAEFCSWLGIQDLNKMLVDRDPDSVDIAHYLVENSTDDSEIQIDEEIFDDGEDFVLDTRPTPDTLPSPKTPREAQNDPLNDFVPPKLTPKTPKDTLPDVLDDFVPPKITPKAKKDDSSDEVVFKRRKVDIPDEE